MSDIGQKLIRKVRDIAAARPEYVYDASDEQCFYTLEGQPSCIIGHALFKLGYLPSETYIEGFGAGVALTHLGVALDYDEKRWMDYVQEAQDGRAFGLVMSVANRLSWGGAVQFADAKLACDEPRLNAIRESLKVGSL